MSNPAPAPTPRPLPDATGDAAGRADMRALLLLGGLVFTAAVLGTLSRPLNMLASFWPANAVMLGMMVRSQRLGSSAVAWSVGALALVTSALLMGDAPLKALWLSAANLAGVLAGWLYFQRVPRRAALLGDQLSPLYLLFGCVVAAFAAALVAFAMGPVLFGSEPRRTFLMWFTSEFMNYMLMLPAVLCAPRWPDWTWLRSPPRVSCVSLAPAAVLVASELLAHLMGGPGALGFGVPALLWCALRYRLFTTTVLCLVVGTVKSVTLSMGMMAYTPEVMEEVASMRVALALLSLGPLAVACTQTLRNELLGRLQHAATFDALTGVLSRAAFIERSERLLARPEAFPVAVLMLDIDHFKQINDRHGHAVGDDVLRGFAERLQARLRPSDLFGRLGGEEFAMVLPGISRAEAQSVAQRLCEATRAQPFALSSGEVGPLHATVSIGIAHQGRLLPERAVDELLRRADVALYVAKRQGRDRCAMHGEETVDDPAGGAAPAAAG